MRFHHASLIVSNLARAREFYEGILNLSPNPDRPPKTFDGIWYDVGTQQIHLIVAKPEFTPAGPDGYGGTDRHLALVVDDLVRIRMKLEQAGVSYAPSRSGRPVLFCRDPDGNTFELIEDQP